MHREQGVWWMAKKYNLQGSNLRNCTGIFFPINNVPFNLTLNIQVLCWSMLQWNFSLCYLGGLHRAQAIQAYNSFGWKCRTETLKSPPLLKIVVQERARKTWAKAEALWDFLPWACCLSEFMAIPWLHELPRSHALPSPFLHCLLIFFCKAPPSYKL